MLASSGERVPPCGEDAGSQERHDEGQHASVGDALAHPAHEGPVVDLIETGRDVRVHHPLIGAAGEVVDLGDRVLRPSFGSEAARARRKVRLKDRLQHEFERSLERAGPKIGPQAGGGSADRRGPPPSSPSSPDQRAARMITIVAS
jgi:hypothetical protein